MRAWRVACLGVGLACAAPAGAFSPDLALTRANATAELRVYVGGDGAALCLLPRTREWPAALTSVTVSRVSRRNADPPRILAEDFKSAPLAREGAVAVRLSAGEVSGVRALHVKAKLCHARGCEPAEFEVPLRRPRETASVTMACR